MWPNRSLLVQAFFFAILSLPGLCRANFVGNDTQNFNPTPDGLDFITLQSSQTLSVGILNSGVFVNHAQNALPMTYNTNGVLVDPQDSMTFSDISVAYGAFENFDLGLSISYLMNQKSDQTQSGGQFAANGLNEMRISGKYSVLPRSPVGVAMIASVNINEARNNPFAGTDSGPTLNLEAAADYQIGSFLLGGNFGFRNRSKGKRISGSIYEPLPNQFIASMGLSYYVQSIDTKLIGEIFAAKPTESVAFVDAGKIGAEALFGLKYDAYANASIQGGFGGKISEALFTPDWRVYVGVNFTFDLLNRPATPPAQVAAAAAPVPETTQNATTVQYNVYQGYQPKDIVDLQPVPFDEISKRHEFRLKTSVPAKDFHGEKPPFEIVRLDQFDFDFGSSAIRSEYFPMLSNLAAYLNSEPKVLKIRVEGHTDSLGSLERNRKRSQERAEAVQAFLQKAGVKAETEIDAIGFGADRPIADNGNFQGRKQNRRVEIRILRSLSPLAPETR